MGHGKCCRCRMQRWSWVDESCLKKYKGIWPSALTGDSCRVCRVCVFFTTHNIKYIDAWKWWASLFLTWMCHGMHFRLQASFCFLDQLWRSHIFARWKQSRWLSGFVSRTLKKEGKLEPMLKEAGALWARSLPGPSPDLAGFIEGLSKMVSNWLWRKYSILGFP